MAGWISINEANQARIFSVFPLDSHLYYFLLAHYVKPKGLEVCDTHATSGKLYLN
jgi:hypothetical protein